MIRNISVRKLRANLSHVIDDVASHLDRYMIFKRGQPEAVLMCVDDYEGWLETIGIMSSKKTMSDINAARKELAAGKFYTMDEVFGKGHANTKAKKR